MALSGAWSRVPAAAFLSLRCASCGGLGWRKMPWNGHTRRLPRRDSLSSGRFAPLRDDAARAHARRMLAEVDELRIVLVESDGIDDCGSAGIGERGRHAGSWRATGVKVRSMVRAVGSLMGPAAAGAGKAARSFASSNSTVSSSGCSGSSSNSRKQG